MGPLSILLCLYAVLLGEQPTTALPTRNDAVKYFQKFGYIGTFTGDPPAQLLEKRIRIFQKNANLPVTGVFDRATLEQMEKPRCGQKDNVDQEVGEFTLQGGKWKKRLLTWRVVNDGYQITKEETRKVFRKATAIWSKYTNVDFEEKLEGTADIMVLYGRYNHGDLYSFDGRGGTLAHAFYPYDGSEIAGDVHYDDDENFVIDSNEGTELTWVTIHELGHSLGLEHSYDQAAIMYPWYKGYQPNYDLDKDDIAGIQALYGVRSHLLTQAPTTTPSTTPTTTAAPTTTPSTSLPVTLPVTPTGCLDRITALLKPKSSGWLYVFTGDTFSLADRYGFLKYRGLKVKSYFPRVQGEVTAAFADPQTDLSFIFVQGGFYKFRGFSFAQDFKSLQSMGLPEFVTKIDAAFIWTRNKRAYLFSGPRYWRYNVNTELMDPGYPRYIQSAWKGLPDDLSAATTGLDDITYFVKGNKYYVLNDWSVSVKNGYPLAVGDRWMTCGSSAPGGLSVGPGSIELRRGPEGAEP